MLGESNILHIFVQKKNTKELEQCIKAKESERNNISFYSAVSTNTQFEY